MDLDRNGLFPDWISGLCLGLELYWFSKGWKRFVGLKTGFQGIVRYGTITFTQAEGKGLEKKKIFLELFLKH